MKALSFIAIALAGCDGEIDPCAGTSGTCVALRVESASVERIDQLELGILYGGRHSVTTTQLPGKVATLPVVVAIELSEPGLVEVGIVAAGKLSGTVRGTGAATALVEPDERKSIEIELALPASCVAGSLYCGGDLLAGDHDTLYTCNGGGVPLARGACDGGCIVRPDDDDVCRGVGEPCVDDGSYCGGNRLDGDPRVLYRCSAGLGVAPQPCADDCVVAPLGNDDYCR